MLHDMQRPSALVAYAIVNMTKFPYPLRQKFMLFQIFLILDLASFSARGQPKPGPRVQSTSTLNALFHLVQLRVHVQQLIDPLL